MASINEMINLHQYMYARPQGGQSAFGTLADIAFKRNEEQRAIAARAAEEERQMQRAQRLMDLFNTADQQANRVNTDLEKASRQVDNPDVGASVVNFPGATMSLASGGVGDYQGNKIEAPTVTPIPSRQNVIPSRANRYSLEPNISMAGGEMNVGVRVKDSQGENDVLFKEAALRGIDPNGKTREQIYSELAGVNMTSEKADRLKNNDYFNKADKMRDDFDRLSKDFRLVRDAYSRIEASAQDPSAAGDLALIFNYMKTLDPGSTVREGEFATAQNSASVPDRLRAQYNKVISGERLAPEQRADFVNRARKLYKSQADIQGNNVNLYKKRAERFGIDPIDVITELDSNDALMGGASINENANIDQPQQGGYSIGQVIQKGGASYKIVDFDTDGEPLVELME